MADRGSRYEGPEQLQTVHSHGNGLFTNVPVWIKVIFGLGPLAGIAVYLVWIGAELLPKVYTEVLAIKAQHDQGMIVSQQTLHEMEEMNRLLRRICSAAAKTDYERQQCFDR